MQQRYETNEVKYRSTPLTKQDANINKGNAKSHHTLYGIRIIKRRQ